MLTAFAREKSVSTIFCTNVGKIGSEGVKASQINSLSHLLY